MEFNGEVRHKAARNGMVGSIILIALVLILSWMVCRPYSAHPENSIDNLTGMRTLTINGETVRIPYEVPNFLAPPTKISGIVIPYTSDKLTVFIMAFDDPFGRPWKYYVTSIAITAKYDLSYILSIATIDDYGRCRANYIDKQLQETGVPSGDLTKGDPPNIMKVVKILERRTEL